MFLAYSIFLICLTWPITSFKELTFSKTAQLGDSFGVLTSLFSGLAFAGLIITILLQREELRESREIFRKQRFEDAFYRLLAFYHKNLEAVVVTDEDKSNAYEGVSALKKLLQNLTESMVEFTDYTKSMEHRDLYTYYLFSSVHKSLGPQSRYLGTLESLLSLIDTELKVEEEKSIYTNIIASQLTSYEARFIFFSCLVASEDNELRKLVHSSPKILERLSQLSISKTHSEIYEKIHGVKIYRTRKKPVLPFKTKQKARFRKTHKNIVKEKYNKDKQSGTS